MGIIYKVDPDDPVQTSANRSKAYTHALMGYLCLCLVFASVCYYSLAVAKALEYGFSYHIVYSVISIAASVILLAGEFALVAEKGSRKAVFQGFVSKSFCVFMVITSIVVGYKSYKLKMKLVFIVAILILGFFIIRAIKNNRKNKYEDSIGAPKYITSSTGKYTSLITSAENNIGENAHDIMHDSKQSNKNVSFIYCRFCGKRIPKDSDFCSYCGKKL